ncbi:MAG: transporter substrate-binding domain-containing protein [Clostridia bacterium]|nr:transporter substrate-binding domain-containing protein [Clostridia bacterium]
MKRNKKPLKILIIVATLLMMFYACIGTVFASTNEAKPLYNTLDQLVGKRIAYKIGGAHADTIMKHKYFKGTDTNMLSYQTESDCIIALESNKVDGFCTDLPVAQLCVNSDENLAIVPEYFQDEQYAYVFAKGSELEEPFNKAMAELKEEGAFERLQDIWMGSDESKKVLPEQDWDCSKGTLHYWVDNAMPPASYVKDGKLVGYEVNLVYLVAEKMHYAVEITGAQFGALIPAVSSGKADLCSGCITITDERKKSVDFSLPNYDAALVLVVLNDKAGTSDVGFFQSMEDSFNKTFLVEDRWELFVDGIGLTLLITIFAVIFGSLLGFGIYMLYRRNNRIINGATNIVMEILSKTPAVVLLMVFFYIIFKDSNLSGPWIAIITFSFTFGANVFSLLQVGVGAVDSGQMEGALALGFTKFQSFFKIVLPQAITHIMPTYNNEIVNLLKGTAVVGYIAVSDLTKVSDIVRSRTYEAFFPLIATALIYILLAWILIVITKAFARKIDTKFRKKEKILKGVNHD